MKYITPCPECGRNLRFPLDKGKIKIRCTCGYGTIIDPDDTSLYKKGRFDVEPEKQHKNRKKKIKKASPVLNRDTIIRMIYDFKYSVQNIKHMPDREKYRLLLLILLPIILLGLILYFFLTVMI